MAVWTFADGFQTTLSAGISSGATTFAPTSTTGQPGADATLPTPTQFACVLQSATYPGSGTREVVTVTSSTSGTWTCTATANAYLTGDIVAAVVSSASLNGLLAEDDKALWLPTGAIAANYDRRAVASGSVTYSTGTLYLSGIKLIAGKVITSVNVRIGSGGFTATVSHSWVGLFDANRVCLKLSADDTTGTATASTTKTWNLSTTYTVPNTGAYYVGVMVASSGTISMIGMAGVGLQSVTIPPITDGTSNTSQTTPPSLPFTANALAASQTLPYIWLT